MRSAGRLTDLRRYEEAKRELGGKLYVDRYAKGTAILGSGVLGIFGIDQSLEHHHTPLAVGAALGAAAIGYLGHKFTDYKTRDDIREARRMVEITRDNLVQE